MLRLLPPAYRAPLAQPVFRRLFPGFVASSVGDGLSVVTIVWLALELAPRELEGIAVGASVAAYTLPGIAAGLLLGRRLGRLDARRLLLADSLLRALCLGAIPVAEASGRLDLGLYVGLLGASSLLHAWGLAGRHTLVAELLPPEHRLAGNALLVTQWQAAMIVGAPVAGVLLTVLEPSVVIGVDAASYAVLAALLGSTRGARARVAGAPGRSRAGLRAVLRSPALRALLAVTFVFNFLYGPVEVALPVYVARDLDGSAALLGAMWTAWGAAALVGGLLVGSFTRLPLWPAAVAIVAGWGLALLPLGLVETTALAVAAWAIGGFVYAPYPAVAATLLQRETPAADLAAASALWSSVLLASTPVGAAVGGPLVAWLGAQGTLLASAVATLALAAAAAFLGRGRARFAPP